MKYAHVLLLASFLFVSQLATAQKSEVEARIRQLEKAQCDAIVQHDSVALYKIWAHDFTVNTPTNEIVKLEGAKFAIRNRFIDYSLFESKLEEIMILNDLVVTMGSEIIKPIGNAPMAGQTLNRRYTQVWMKRNGEWKLIARHANIITP